MDFSDALFRLRNGGARIRRIGWNGRGMWLGFVRANQVNMHCRITRPMPVLQPITHNDPVTEDISRDVPVRYEAHIFMRTAQGSFVPWLASQTDMLSDDWEEVPFGE